MAIHHPIAIRFNDEDHAVIRALMQRTGQPIAGVLRYAIRVLLQQLGGTVPEARKPAKKSATRAAKKSAAKKSAAKGKKP